jgi:hypothetical protein
MVKWFSQKALDILQWVLIIGLFVMLLIQGLFYQQAQKDLVTAAEYNKQNTYVRIYESQKLNKLKRENRELYDSISKLKDVESGMIIQFREHYNTDTVREFTVQHDTVYKNGELIIDSIYHHTQSNDTVNLNIDVKAKELQWVTADFTISDKFIIINREKNGVNETAINHSGNTIIEGTTMWHRQEDKKWYQRFTIGPQVGVGYGTINKNFDVYAGFGISYQLNK